MKVALARCTVGTYTRYTVKHAGDSQDSLFRSNVNSRPFA